MKKEEWRSWTEINTDEEGLEEFLDSIECDNGIYRMEIEAEKLEKDDPEIVMYWDIVLDYQDGEYHTSFWDGEEKERVIKNFKVVKGKDKVEKVLSSLWDWHDIYGPMLRRLRRMK
ncbi:MAG: hypothetical protein QXS37_06570 [Candidatus Aenigmatarchaeota archaeon]